MKKVFGIVLMMLFCLLCINIYAAEKDADGCKDHPLIPRMQGYYIAGCNEIPAGADLDIIKGAITEPVHFEGTSIAFSYMPQPGLKTTPSEARLRSHFDAAIKQLDGALFGITFGQKWPVYTFVKDGKKYWVILMVDSGKYYNGSYAYRIIKKE